MKQVLIDLYKSKNPYSGLGRFSICFAEEISKRRGLDLDFTFLLPSGSSMHFDDSIQIEYANFKKRILPILNKDYTIWHSLNQFPSHFPNRNTKQLLTIHDLNFLIEKAGKKRTKYLNQLQKNVDRADAISTISLHSKNVIEEFIDLKGKEVKVIYNGVEEANNKDIEKPKNVEESEFFFSIGIFNEKKNFHVLVEMMSYLPDKKLILAGDFETGYGKQVQELVKKKELSNQVVLLGKVKESEKNWLYQNCEALLFPSLAEGFGMPVIEAMNFGKPVVLSSSTCLPEIGGKEAFYFPNYDIESMAEFVTLKMNEYHSNQRIMSANLLSRGRSFSWETCITKYLELYSEIIQ